MNRAIQPRPAKAASIMAGRLTAATILLLPLALIATPTTSAPPDSEPADQNQQLAHEILSLFREKRCVECHGSAVVRPKKFGFIDDLSQLRADPGLVVPGEPDQSELLYQVEAELMPPEKAESTPLTQEQVSLVRTWIQNGSPVPGTAPPLANAAGNGQHSLDTAANPSQDPLLEISFSGRVMRFLGKLHPVSVHFPIAFLVGALLGEMWRVATSRTGMQAAVRFCLWIGALSATPAATLGWIHAYHSGYADWTSFADVPLAVHRWLGLLTAICAWAVLILYEVVQRRDSPGLRMHLHWALGAAALLAMLTGFFGGLVTYGGLSHYSF